MTSQVAQLVKAGLPPGPIAPAPIQTLRQMRDPYGFLLDCHRRYGDYFTLKLIPCGTLVYVADPATVRSLFSDPGLAAGAINAYMRPLLGDSLLTLDGAVHAAHRKLLAPWFSVQRSSAHAQIIVEETEREVSSCHGELALRPVFERLALRVIHRILFGGLPALEPLIAKLKQRSIVEGAAAIVAQRVGMKTRASRIVDDIDRLVLGLIARRRSDHAGAARGEARDVLAGLLLTPLDDRAIRDELLTLLFAGHETVATTLAWVVERAVRHPAVLAKLAGAADDAYVDTVIKETMRVRSCLPDVGRALLEPTAVGRWHLPAGTRVFPAIVPIHMRADLYPNPEEFRPERFTQGLPEPWAFLPFGGGARRCIGAALAMLEIRVVLQTLFARVRLRAVTPDPERGVSNGVTIAPHAGARVYLEHRR